MAQKNDDRIMQLKQQIKQKKEELTKCSSRFIPVTNCLLHVDGEMYNLHVLADEFLLVKLNAWKHSAEDLGLNPDTVKVSGYSLSEWIDDVRQVIEVKRYKEEKKKLEKLEKQLNDLLSDDKKTELEIDNIAALLG